MKKTARGFSIYGEFKDNKGSTVCVQQSSSIIPSVWIFCENQNMAIPTPHLSVAQAKRVIKYLQKFIGDMEG